MDGDGPREKYLSIAEALSYHDKVMAAYNRYGVILESAVFKKQTLLDRKAQISSQKKLLEFDSYMVLVHIWAGSERVHQQSANSGQNRPVITCYSIARKYAYGREDVRAANEAVYAICRPAVTYGLIERVELAKNKVDLVGTPLLHAVMTGMCLPDTDVVTELLNVAIYDSAQELN